MWVLHVEYAGGKNTLRYSIHGLVGLFYEYSNLDFVRIHVIARINQAESCGCATRIREYLFNTWGVGVLRMHEQRDVLTTFDDGHSDDFLLRRPFREKNFSIPAAAGSTPSMPLLVFWPLLSPRRRHCFSALCSAVVV